MAKRVFVVALDGNDPSSDVRVFRNAIKDNPDIKSWWNYIPFVYLFVTELNADDLSVSLYKRSGIRRFFVVQVNLAESEGLLPDEAWAWIKRQTAMLPSEHTEQAVPAAAEG